MVLYRKYRPQKFSDVVGQNHIKKTLTNALLKDVVGHAYLFSGPRGTGKTTIARILAKSINCQNRVRDLSKSKSESKEASFEPCNECVSCREITLDKSMDVMEIDAASNRGIDEIRALRDKIQFSPSGGRYKVYIIDEVHMLTREAFNALLKTIEEPPKHAIFIMATTELNKVPETILSRTQQFDFKRASTKDITDYLTTIVETEKIKTDPQVLATVAHYAGGSFRDSATILDQIVAANNSSIITVKDVQAILGLVDEKIIFDLLNLIRNSNVENAIDLINDIYQEGYDLAELCHQTVSQLRLILIDKTGSSLSGQIESVKLTKIKELTEKFSFAELLVMIKIFLKAGKEVRSATLAQLPLELAVVEFIQNLKLSAKRGSADSGKTKNHNIKIKSEEPENHLNTRTSKHLNNKTEEQGSIKTIEYKEEKADCRQLIADNSLSEKWPLVLEELAHKNHSLSLLLKDSELLEIKEDKLVLAVKFKFYAERIREPEKYRLVTEVIEKVMGRALAVECLVQEKKVASNEKIAEDNSLLTDALEIFG